MSETSEMLQGERHAYASAKIQANLGPTTLCVATMQTQKEGRAEQRVRIELVELASAPTWAQIQDFKDTGTRFIELGHPRFVPPLDLIAQEDAWGRPAYGTVIGSSPGTPLHELATASRLPISFHLAWFEQALQLLVEMHEHTEPLIHGNLSWSSVTIKADDAQHTSPQVLIAHPLGHHFALTPHARFAGPLALGKLDFRPIELLVGQVTPASDLYALGMTLVAAASTTAPEDFPLEGIRPRVEDLMPSDSPAALTRLLVHMTQPDLAHRLRSARVALERVRALIGHSDRKEVPPPSLFARADAPAFPASTRPLTDDEVDHLLYHTMSQSAESLKNTATNKSWEDVPQIKRDRVSAFAIDRDGSFMVVANNHKGWGYNLGNLREQATFTFEEIAQAIAISRDGRHVAVLTGVEDLRLYDVQMSVWLKHAIKVDGMWPGRANLTLSDDGTMVAISDDDQVNIYDWDSGTLLTQLQVDGQHELDYSDDGRILGAVGEHHATLIGPEFECDEFECDALLFGPDGQITAYTRGRDVFITRVDTSHWPLDLEEDVRSLTLHHMPDGAPLRMLRFSPDARYLLIASPGGGFCVVETETLTLLPWQDHHRATARTVVRLFEAGFSADSTRLLIHANLPEDDTTDPHTGSVLAWDVATGRYLGALLMIDGEPSTLTPPFFHAPLSSIGMQGFGEFRWKRPEIAPAAWLGQDTTDQLTPLERSGLAEFSARIDAFKHLMPRLGQGADTHALMAGTAGLGAVLGRIWRDALSAQQQEKDRPYDATIHPLPYHLVHAAFALQGDHDIDALGAIHRDEMHRLEPTALAIDQARHHASQLANAARQHHHHHPPTHRVATPTTAPYPTEPLDHARARLLAILRHAAPMRACRQLGSVAHPVDPDLDFRLHPQPKRTSPSSFPLTQTRKPNPIALSLSLGIGYGVIFLFFALDGTPHDGNVLAAFLLIMGPLLCVVAYFALCRPFLARI